MKEYEMKKFISNELSKFYFKKYTKGFKYLNEAILICIKDENAIDNLEKNVFTKIASIHNEKSALNVKWTIEQIIKTMYNNTSANILSNYFNIDKYLKPTTKFIIYTIVCKYNNIKEHIDYSK